MGTTHASLSEQLGTQAPAFLRQSALPAWTPDKQNSRGNEGAPPPNVPTRDENLIWGRNNVQVTIPADGKFVGKGRQRRFKARIEIEKGLYVFFNIRSDMTIASKDGFTITGKVEIIREEGSHIMVRVIIPKKPGEPIYEAVFHPADAPRASNWVFACQLGTKNMIEIRKLATKGSSATPN